MVDCRLGCESRTRGGAVISAKEACDCDCDVVEVQGRES